MKINIRTLTGITIIFLLVTFNPSFADKNETPSKDSPSLVKDVSTQGAIIEPVIFRRPKNPDMMKDTEKKQYNESVKSTKKRTTR